MLIGVFARADHPEGWGYPRVDGFHEESGSYTMERPVASAHGYSLMTVACADHEQLAKVSEVLGRGFAGDPDSDRYQDRWLGEWFGGRFEHVATVAGTDLHVVVGDQPGQHAVLFGDNRAAFHFDAETILGIGTALPLPVQ